MLKTGFSILHTTLYLCVLCLRHLEVWMERENLWQVIFTIEQLTTLYVFSELTLRHNKYVFFDFPPPIGIFYVRMYCEGPTLNTWEFEHCGLCQIKLKPLFYSNRTWRKETHVLYRFPYMFLKYVLYKFSTKCKVSVSQYYLVFPFLFKNIQ
jgi:hypothetical protein